MKYLDKVGCQTLVNKLKTYVDNKISNIGGGIITSNNNATFAIGKKRIEVIRNGYGQRIIPIQEYDCRDTHYIELYSTQTDNKGIIKLKVNDNTIIDVDVIRSRGDFYLEISVDNNIIKLDTDIRYVENMDNGLSYQNNIKYLGDGNEYLGYIYEDRDKQNKNDIINKYSVAGTDGGQNVYYIGEFSSLKRFNTGAYIVVSNNTFYALTDTVKRVYQVGNKVIIA